MLLCNRQDISLGKCGIKKFETFYGARFLQYLSFKGLILVCVELCYCNIFSLLSLLDTVLSRKKRVDHYIQRRANQLETNIYEAKKKEYFSLLGVTDEDLKLFPQVE